MNDQAEKPHESMFERFRRAAQIDADNWRDPQHDLEAIRLASPDERVAIERFLLGRGVRHYIDAEALALLDTPSARQALADAFHHGTTELRAAVASVAPHVIPSDKQLAELVQRVGECDAYQGLSLTLTQIETMHPPEVIDAMLRRMVRDPGVAAVHFAGLLLYLHGHADEPFDWELRPFLLRFNPGDDSDRREAFAELCRRIGADPAPYSKL
ncbi:MAG TPA: hypothetical protein PKD54_01245, partial [Pirellulaceae bacterium]|nr:hypothetical protein [Pirellulaceae bacterium]